MYDNNIHVTERYVNEFLPELFLTADNVTMLNERLRLSLHR